MDKKGMSESGTNIIGMIALLLIVVSLASIGMKLTGYVTDTGIINVTVESSASINFTDDYVNFGSGQVSGGQQFAILESNGTAATNGNWSWSADSFTIENNGNVNVSLMIATTKSASSFIGGAAPQYNFSVSEAEVGSCFENVTLTAWLPVNNTGDGTLVCGPLYSADGTDSVNLDIRLVIPSDSRTGVLTDTITATAESM